MGAGAARGDCEPAWLPATTRMRPASVCITGISQPRSNAGVAGKVWGCAWDSVWSSS
ncbi:hypothetical protein D3C73_1535730 [compost metagenome]